MVITIINGNQEAENVDFDNWINALVLQLSSSHRVYHIQLRIMDIKYCTGCFCCWQKTPGKCLQKDDMEEVYKYYMQSDLVLYASPIIMGFTSSLLKTCNDRMIALIHPYAEISEGKLKHMKRYESYPKLGLLLQNDIDTDEEDIQIINDIYSRIASSFSSQFVYSKVINENLLGIVADEVSNL